MKDTQVYKSSMLDILFEGRNKAYGAYVLRKEYSKMLFQAFGLALALVALGLAWPYISTLLKEKEEIVAPKKRVVTNLSELAPPPPLNDVPPPPKMEIPELKETLKFTPPQITKEEVVEEQMPDQEELKTTTAGATTNDAPIDYSGLETGTETVIEETKEEEIFDYVEQQPEFPGGEDAMLQYISSKIVYPKAALENNIQGKVVVQFVVDKDGKIINVKVVRSLNFGCDEEAERVVKSMPAWKPGKNNGKPVKVYYQVPIFFTLE